jgi:hypothetical protein
MILWAGKEFDFKRYVHQLNVKSKGKREINKRVLRRRVDPRCFRAGLIINGGSCISRAASPLKSSHLSKLLRAHVMINTDIHAIIPFLGIKTPWP